MRSIVLSLLNDFSIIIYTIAAGFSAISFPHTYCVNVYDELMCYRLFYFRMCDDLSGRDYVLHINSNCM